MPRCLKTFLLWSVPVLALSCNQTEMGGETAKKSGNAQKGCAQGKTDPSCNDQPSPSVPATPLPPLTPPVTTKQQRLVDCGGLSPEQCQQKVTAEGPGPNVQVGVNNCPDQSGFCDKLEAQTGVDVLTRTSDGANVEGGEMVASIVTASVGLTVDGLQTVCLDWHAGTIIVTNLDRSHNYFRIQGAYDVTLASGQKQSVQITNEGTFPVPGDWTKVCDANATMSGFSANGRGGNKPPPVISTTKQGTQACFNIDDNIGNRPGTVTIHGVDFNIKRC